MRVNGSDVVISRHMSNQSRNVNMVDCSREIISYQKSIEATLQLRKDEKVTLCLAGYFVDTDKPTTLFRGNFIENNDDQIQK